MPLWIGFANNINLKCWPSLTYCTYSPKPKDKTSLALPRCLILNATRRHLTSQHLEGGDHFYCSSTLSSLKHTLTGTILSFLLDTCACKKIGTLCHRGLAQSCTVAWYAFRQERRHTHTQKHWVGLRHRPALQLLRTRASNLESYIQQQSFRCITGCRELYSS